MLWGQNEITEVFSALVLAHHPHFKTYVFLDFSSGPVIESTLQCRGLRFTSWLGNWDPACHGAAYACTPQLLSPPARARVHEPQWKIPQDATKAPCTAAKTWYSPISKCVYIYTQKHTYISKNIHIDTKTHTYLYLSPNTYVCIPHLSQCAFPIIC